MHVLLDVWTKSHQRLQHRSSSLSSSRCIRFECLQHEGYQCWEERFEFIFESSSHGFDEPENRRLQTSLSSPKVADQIENVLHEVADMLFDYADKDSELLKVEFQNRWGTVSHDREIGRNHL